MKFSFDKGFKKEKLKPGRAIMGCRIESTAAKTEFQAVLSEENAVTLCRALAIMFNDETGTKTLLESVAEALNK